MTDFIEGENRAQAVLFPERLDDYIAEDKTIGAFNLSGLGFKTVPDITGRPAYHLATTSTLKVLSDNADNKCEIKE
jgi:hypothetical protein